MATNAPSLTESGVAEIATNLHLGMDIREVKPPVDVPGGWGWGWWIIPVALLTIALAVFLLRRSHRWWQSDRKPENSTTPHVLALDQLEEAVLLIGTPEPFCVAVSDAVRLYLESQFDLKAPERTTEEFLEEAKSSAMLSSGHKSSLAEFLTQCDLVKFARYKPARAELASLHAAAVRFVRETEPRTEDPVEGADSGVKNGREEG